MRVFFGLGSNKGDRFDYINKAVNEIGSVEGIEVLKSASVYETEPWGKKDQDIFLNTVIETQTDITPEQLVKIVKTIEQKLERTKREKWAEREIDIDILFYGGLVTENDSLTIPHTEIENRNFVLVPMNEIAPDFIHPKLNKSIKYLTENTKDNLQVHKTGLKIYWTK